MRRPKPHIGKHPGVRSGVFYLLVLLLLLHVIRFGFSRFQYRNATDLIIQSDTLLQSRLDSIRKQFQGLGNWTLRPLDPNHLEDYRGYLLGIPAEALDRLYAFRSRGGILYGIEEFQHVTRLSDTTCRRLQSFFQFPDRLAKPGSTVGAKLAAGRDLNRVTAMELRMISGIGPVLSERIIRFRAALGGFLDASQLYDVYGLKPEIARRVMEVFPLASVPEISRLDLNTASVDELASLVYLNWQMAEDLIALRDSLGSFKSIQELREVESLPADRIERIALYLEL